MKHQFKLLVSLLAIGVIALASCKKKSDDSVKSKLTGKWKIIRIGSDVNSNGNLDANEITAIPDSITEYFTFNGDGSGNTSVSYASTTETTGFTWSLVNNNADIKLTVTSGSSTGVVSTASILSLTSTDLEIKSSDNTTSGATTWVYMHKQ